MFSIKEGVVIPNALFSGGCRSIRMSSFRADVDLSSVLSFKAGVVLLNVLF